MVVSKVKRILKGVLALRFETYDAKNLRPVLPVCICSVNTVVVIYKRVYANTLYF